MQQPKSLKIIPKEKARSTFSKSIGQGAERTKGQKPQGPLGHQGTEVLALPDDRRRPEAVGVASPVGAQLQLTVADPTVKGRHVRPVGDQVELIAGHVRIRRLASVPAGNPLREERHSHEDFSVRQRGAVNDDVLQCLLGRLALVGVGIERHPADARFVFVPRETQVLGIALELFPAPLGQTSRGDDEVPPGVEGTVDTLHTTLVGKHDGEQQDLGLGARGEVGHGGDVGRPEAFLPTMQFEEGRNPLDLCVHRAVPRRRRDERSGLVFDDVLERASHSHRVQGSVQEPILDEP